MNTLVRSRWILSAALPALFALLAVLVLAPSARADFPTLYGGDVTCAEQSGNGKVRLCGGETTTWDGVTQIDVNVVLPPQPSSGEAWSNPVCLL